MEEIQKVIYIQVKNTYTDFNPLSGNFLRSANDFHANNIHNNDMGYFGRFADLCHHQTLYKTGCGKKTNSVGKYYRGVIGFDGWRFDYVKGFEPWVVKDWKMKSEAFLLVNIGMEMRIR